MSSSNNETPEVSAAAKSQSKGHPTPTRKEREAANRRPLVPSDRKEAARANKAKLAEERNRARIGMAKGEEKYLPLRDRGPQRKFARDYVDARYNLGELMIPFMLLVIVMSFIPIYDVQVTSTLVLWVFVLLVIVDASFVGMQIRKKVTQKFGSMEKGVRWYAAMRSLQMRSLRLPKPQVKRREYPQ